MSILPMPANLPLSLPSDDESRLVDRLLNDLSIYEPSNALKAAYYEGEQRVQMLNIAIPPSLSRLETVAGWPGTVADVLEERLDWYGWASEAETFDLDQVYRDNLLEVEAGNVHLDALIYGTAFAVVGSGEDDEPSPLVTTHSPRSLTGRWDARRRRLGAALSAVSSEGQVVEVTLYLPDETVVLSRPPQGGQWRVDDRDRHNLGRVPVVQFTNRTRASRLTGRSEITRAVRYYTDAAVRTLLGMEVNREFYSAPQRYALGVDADDFTSADGTVRTGWETVMGRIWAIDRDEDGNLPEVGQFTPASPAPYLEQVKGLAQLLAAEAAIPSTYLGFQTDNPASADAIRAGEARLVKRAERRQGFFGASWLEVGKLALLVRDGQIPDDFSSVTAKWRDASTPTRAAATDEAVKLSQGDDPIIPRNSAVLYDRVGLTPSEQRQVAADKRRATGTRALNALTQVPQPNADGNAAP